MLLADNLGPLLQLLLDFFFHFGLQKILLAIEFCFAKIFFKNSFFKKKKSNKSLRYDYCLMDTSALEIFNVAPFAAFWLF